MFPSEFSKLFLRPLVAAFILLLALPPLSWLSQTSPDRKQSGVPFRLGAQTTSSGCPPSANQILQAGCNYLFNIFPQFEQAAVQNYLSNHNLPLSDAQYIYSLGGTELRNEIRAYMFQLLVAYSGSDLSKLNDVQGNVYSYLESQVQAEEKLYWAAAAAEYESWKSSPCRYQLDVDVATQQGLHFDPAQWCYPSLAGLFSTPPVPTQNYFLAVAWKKTYGKFCPAIPRTPVCCLICKGQPVKTPHCLRCRLLWPPLWRSASPPS